MHESLIKEFLIERDPDFKKLYLQHYRQQKKLNRLQVLEFRSHREEMAFKALKKKKLELKDRMQVKINRYKEFIES